MTIELIKLYFKEKKAIADSVEIEPILNLVNQITKTYNHDGAVYLIANGGPVGAIDGFSTDLKTHPFVLDDKSKTTDIRRIKVHNLVESTGIITGITNDISSDFIFVEQMKNFVRNNKTNKNDILIGFSGSGNSKNVLNAFEFAKTFGIFTACISGRGGGKAINVADLNIVIPGSSNFPGQTGKNDNNFYIEDFQVSVTHIITGLLKLHVSEPEK